jgi:hypothetical protein
VARVLIPLDTALFHKFPAAETSARKTRTTGRHRKSAPLKALAGKMYRTAHPRHLIHVDVDLWEVQPMERRFTEVVGVRRTGWAALDRDPQQDKVEFVCPHCGARDQKNARRERSLYHFTDGFLQDLQGEVAQCHSCKQSVRVVPVVMLHDQGETRRFEAVFADEPMAAAIEEAASAVATR